MQSNKRSAQTPLSATENDFNRFTRSRARLQGNSEAHLEIDAEPIAGSRGGGSRGRTSHEENAAGDETNALNNEAASNNNRNSELNRNRNENQIENINQIESPSRSNSLIGRSQYSISEMFDMAKRNMFPQKFIYYGKDFSQKKAYTSVLNFYDHREKFNEKPLSKQKFDFTCIISECKLVASFGAVSNLNTHLLKHDSTKAWYKSYKKTKKIEVNTLFLKAN